jgi:3-oxoadipate enol-lactonase
MATKSLEPGLTIHYQDFNTEGFPAVLLLHGLGANCDSWQLQVPDLVNAGFRVIIPDLRGFGKSPYPGGRNSPRVMAGDMVHLIARLGIEKTHLAGISLGGTVALEIVTSKPDIVQSLVITNSFAKLRPQKISVWFFYLIRLLIVHVIGLDAQASYASKRLFPMSNQELLRTAFKEQVCSSNPSGYRSSMRSLAFFDVREEVTAIKVPTLVISGESDNVVPLANQSELANLIPNAKQEIIPDCGHAVIVEKPAEYNQILTKFLLEHN